MKVKHIFKIIFIALLLFSTFVFFLGKKINVTQSPIKSDLIICLGGGYVERLNKGIQLYKKGFADKIIFTGSGIGLLHKDDKLGFWKVPFFKEKGVQVSDVFFLDNTPNTYREVEVVKDYMLKHGYKTVLIVSDPSHSRRIKYLVDLFQYKKNDLEVKIIASEVSWWSNYKYFDSFRSFWEAMKEVIALGYYTIRYTLL